LLPRITSPVDAGVVPGAKTAKIRDIRALRLAIAAAQKGKKAPTRQKFPSADGRKQSLTKMSLT
jgi:hypothetical protein